MKSNVLHFQFEFVSTGLSASMRLRGLWVFDSIKALNTDHTFLEAKI